MFLFLYSNLRIKTFSLRKKNPNSILFTQIFRAGVKVKTSVNKATILSNSGVDRR